MMQKFSKYKLDVQGYAARGGLLPFVLRVYKLDVQGFDSRANVSLRFGHVRGKTIINRFLRPHAASLRAQSFAGKTRPPEEFSTRLLLRIPSAQINQKPPY